MKLLQEINEWTSKNSGRIWGDVFQFDVNASSGSISSLETGSALFFLKEGQISIEADQDSYLIGQGDLVLISGAKSVRFQAAGPSSTGWFILVPNLSLSHLTDKVNYVEITDLLKKICERIVSWGAGQNPDSDMNLILSVFRAEILKTKKRSTLALPMPTHPKLLKVTLEIKRNPQDMQSLDFWARSAGLSKRTFTRQFLKETGMSFGLWRQRMKVSFAVREISSGRSVAETARILGYQTTSAFIAVFKKHLGTTPKKYGKSH